MMVHCPGWDDAVRQARTAPGLGIGLHFNLLVGAPLAKASSLTDRRSGRFLSLAALVRRSLTGFLDADEVAAECEAQLDALAGAGIRCTHIDSHRHTHALPVIHSAVAAVALARGLAMRRPVESHLRMAGGFASQVHRGLVGAAWRLTRSAAGQPRGADHFAGVSLQGDANFADHFLNAVDALAPGSTEIMVHPGHVDDTLRAIDAYTTARERELAALISPRVRDRLRRNDLELTSFRAL
jgi:predicted glycoside hydrolase/deacetylase ChbG (UPF0249 family)